MKTDFALPEGSAAPSPDAVAPTSSTDAVSSTPDPGFGGASATPSATAAPSPVVLTPTTGITPGAMGPSLGDAHADVVMVAYEDLQDPFTKQFHEQVFPKIFQKHVATGKVRFECRAFPLSFHVQAEAAAEAAYCADEQGRFWDFHDEVLREQSRLTSSVALKAMASTLGLDRALFDACLDSHRHQARVQAEYDEGYLRGVTGTPTFYINGEALVGAQPFDAFDQVLAHALGEPVSGTPTPIPTPSASVHARDLISTYASLTGESDAPVIVVAFSDYQCPFCRAFAQNTLPQIQRDYIDSGKVRFYFRDFPLSIHSMAHVSAQAARCAGDQGKYWPMHDRIFGKQSAVEANVVGYTPSDLKAWGREIGLDGAAFDACLDSQKHKDAVDADFQAGVSGTPSFFVNGERIVGAQPYSAFKAAIDAELS